MTMVLRWRVPPRQVETRWRGPACLTEAIERDPLYPVAAVIGPPGSGSSAVFPPLALEANATQPAPADGLGSGAWSTVLDQPMFWDGTAWRTIAYFCGEAPSLDWVPQGALAVSDFANDRYWRADIGTCSFGDLWTVDSSGNWYAYDPATAVVPGVGLTTGDVSTITPNKIQAPVSTPELFALIASAGGCTAFGEYEEYTSAAYGNEDGHGFTVGLCFEIAEFSREIGSVLTARIAAGITAGKSRHVANAWSGGPSYSNTQTEIEPPTKAANSMDFSTGAVLCSADGATVPGLVDPGDYSTLDTFVFEVSLTNAYGNKTMRTSCLRHVIFPPLGQAEINALTGPATPTGLLLDFTPGVLPPGVSFARAAGPNTYFNAAGKLEGAATNEARFDYDPATLNALGLLVEEDRTTLRTYSQELDNAAWQKLRTTTVANSAVAPDGTTTADTLQQDGVTSTLSRRAGMSPTLADNTTYTYTFFAKKKDFDCVAVYLSNKSGSVNGFSYFNINTGTLGTASAGVTTTIKDCGNGWYLCRASFDTASGGGLVSVYTALAAGDNNPLLNDTNTLGTYIWGAQLEAGAFQTSYIPATGSAATRAADQLSFTIPAGIGTLRYTFDDDSTQDVAVSPGAYTVPTNLNRTRIKTIEGL